MLYVCGIEILLKTFLGAKVKNIVREKTMFVRGKCSTQNNILFYNYRCIHS
jgi:hypothetical protein